MSRQRIASSRALEILQNLPSDCSDNDGSDNEIDPVVNAAFTSVPVVESEESDSDDDADGQVADSVVQGGPGLIQGRDGSKWRKMVCHLLLRAAWSQYPAISSWTYIIFHKSCYYWKPDFIVPDTIWWTNVEKHKKMHSWGRTKANWRSDLDVFLYELDNFIGLVVARGVIGGRHFPLKSFWESCGVVKCFRKQCLEIDFLKLWDFFALTWRRKDVEIFCRINLLLLHNFGTASYQTAKKHSFHNGTSQWWAACYAFTMQIHLVYGQQAWQIWPKILACSGCRKQIFIQRLSLRKKRRHKKQGHACSHWCCDEAHGSAFPTGL